MTFFQTWDPVDSRHTAVKARLVLLLPVYALLGTPKETEIHTKLTRLSQLEHEFASSRNSLTNSVLSLKEDVNLLKICFVGVSENLLQGLGVPRLSETQFVVTEAQLHQALEALTGKMTGLLSERDKRIQHKALQYSYYGEDVSISKKLFFAWYFTDSQKAVHILHSIIQKAKYRK
eukprot:CAMPEP_0168549950 /NCGR_PEP_ID=MMETSP0413-20121227/5378_1 /TAXON_ID=136452 /ORGANISM="Filamoeba nolandi, Strain NC-AS-23-1" /LENGTH=175 /DNA_ID=CAMNT_0008580375 /DNA_START=216 /DNA_END=740 /DNA_ORIENTATION=-